MNYSLFLLLAISLVIAPALGVDRIGGKIAAVGAFPYIASLRMKNYHYCSGAIINDRWVITAARCMVHVQKYDDISVHVGINKLTDVGTAYKSQIIYPHEGFGLILQLNDIGLIKTQETIQFNSLVQPIALPKSIIDQNDYPAVISGWGTLNNQTNRVIPNDLHYVATTLVSHLTCQAHVPLGYLHIGKVCTFTKTQENGCTGDNGSPLVADNTLVGVASYTYGECTFGYPEVFTRVYMYSDWIKNATSKY